MADRSITIPAARLSPWLDNFRTRHGFQLASLADDRVVIVGTDGARASIAVPFAPLVSSGDLVSDLVTHVALPRRVGAILVRKGGHAVGVFDGSRLVASKVGSNYVQGRTKAGGWSQQRFARRRDNQSRQAYADAADEVVRKVLPEMDSLVEVVTGGDKVAVAAVLADPRLAPLVPLVRPGVLPVEDPRLRVLEAFPAAFLTVTIELNELA